MAYFTNGLFQKLAYFKNGLFQNFCRRHNYRKRDVFFENNATTFGNALYNVYLTYNFVGQCNPEWKSSDDSTCAQYKEDNLCTETGDYGTGWDSGFGTFEDFKNSFGETALVCPECGCKNSAPGKKFCLIFCRFITPIFSQRIGGQNSPTLHPHFFNPFFYHSPFF